MSRIPLNPLGDGLGDYLREQRQSARLSLRQLADRAGISNPYLSQIERGLKRPSAEILQQLAKGLEVSAESLYVRAGILDERQHQPATEPDTRAVISADPNLNQRQKAALLDIYDSFVGARETAPATRGTGSRAGTAAKGARSADTRRGSGTAAARTAAKTPKTVKTTKPTAPKE